MEVKKREEMDVVDISLWDEGRLRLIVWIREGTDVESVLQRKLKVDIMYRTVSSTILNGYSRSVGLNFSNI